LAVYLARTYEGEVWAGWFRVSGNRSGPARDAGAQNLLDSMLAAPAEGATGIVTVRDGTLFLDESDRNRPFTSNYAALRTREQLPLERDFDEDELDLQAEPGPSRVYWRRVRARNRAAVRSLKRLYGQKCQLTGDKYVFPKADGEGYTEAHHLVALGFGGADRAENIVIVSAHVHRMLHHARVAPIDLDQIRRDENGWGSLNITINGTHYRIRWHPRHAEVVARSRPRR